MRKEINRMDYDLEEIFALRRAGWSYSAIGRKYGKDHTTIMYHCNEHGVVPEVPFIPLNVRMASKREKTPSKPKKLPRKPIRDKYADVFAPVVRAGRSYASYLAEAMKRPAERHYFLTQKEVIHPDQDLSSSF